MAYAMDRVIHVRYEGRSTEIPAGTLDLPGDANDIQIKQAVANHLDLPQTSFAGYVIVRNSNAIIVRPEAIYG